MAKGEKAAKGGKPKAPARPLPICVAMVLCNQVITATDHTVSAIRIVDTLKVDGEHKTGEGIEVGTLQLLTIIKAGNARGKFDFMLTCVDPSEKSEPVGLAPEIKFEGGPTEGYNIAAPVRLQWGGPGTYWFELLADNVVIARTPLAVNIGKPDTPQAS